MPSDWIERMAALETSRRQSENILRKALGEFQELLARQIEDDLHEYAQFFPGEESFIEQENEPGCTVIRRVSDAESIYAGKRPEVRFSFIAPMMLCRCKFSHREGIDRDFKLIMLGETGKLGPADGSLAKLSEWLLAPILFDKLADGV